MKRNQFFLTVIRLLVKAVFFYVLGANIHTLYEGEKPLLVDVDEAVVGQSDQTESIMPMNIDFSIICEEPYTRRISLRPVMNKYFGELNRKTGIKLQRPISAMLTGAQSDEFLLDKPPRGDDIDDDTS